MSIGPYLYRGTTAGWPGNIVLQEEKITCTSTDPLVATLFAIECRNHGRAIILASRRSLFDGLLAPANHFWEIESAINLKISPVEFSLSAEVSLEVEKALEILRDLGFGDIPIRIRDNVALRDELLYSYEAGERLNTQQLRGFNSRMLGGEL